MPVTTTVLALFRELDEAERAMRALRSARFDSARISIAEPGEPRVPRSGVAALKGVAAGAAGCALVGAIIGLFMGGFIPMLQPILPGGWFVPFMLGLAGAGTGAVAGLLTSQSATDRGALYYDEEVQAGRIMVVVHAEPHEVEEARRILLREGAFDASPIEAPIKKRGFAG